MEFIIRDIEGNEHGPVDQETLVKWVEDDRVTAQTEVRNSLLGNWKHATDFGFLHDVLEVQASREVAVEDNFNKAAKVVSRFGSLFSKPIVDKKTSFVCAYVPAVAPVSRRMLAFFFDLCVIAVVALMLFSYSIGIAKRVAIRETGSEELREEDILAEQDPDWIEGEQAADSGSSETVDTEQAIKNKSKNAETSTTAVEDKTPAKGEGDEDDKTTEDGEVEAVPEPVVEKTRIPDVIPDNLKAVSPPSIYADSVNGYSLGSVWQNSSSGGLRYVCIGADEGKAMWITTVWLRKTVTTVCAFLLFFALLYYGIAVGFFAQTVGMWYWGIFVVKKDGSEVYFFRAIVWSVGVILLGVLSPLCVYLFRGAPHDLIARIKVIQVAGTPPAG